MARNDIHSPKSIIPGDYDFVAYGYMGSDADCGYVQQQRETLKADMDRTGGTFSHHAHGGTCHICGAHAIYTVIFHHRPSNTYIRTGTDCAEKMEMSFEGADLFKKQVKSALERKAGKEKAKAILASKDLESAYTIYEGNGDHKDEIMVHSIVSQLITRGSLSEKQYNYLRILVDRVASRPAREAKFREEAEAATPVPVTTNRVTVEGKVLTRKSDELFGGSKILVLVDAGWKVWGSCPSSIDCAPGDTIRFDAGIKPSDKDPKFGFFSRPTKAVIVKRG